MRKFSVGQQYAHYDWFSGGRSDMTVSKVSKRSVYFKVHAMEIDGSHKRSERYEIRRDEAGNESVVLYSYRGADCVIEAHEEWEE